MPYHYLAFGLPIVSDLELPALLVGEEAVAAPLLRVSEGEVPPQLREAPLVQKPFSTYNAREFRYEMPGLARYYVTDGTQVVIEALCDRWNEILIYFYSNCLAAVLMQRDLLPLHVSGVFLPDGRVLLFAAPSRTGKSTTALMLQERGYAPFTDDTALLRVADGQCHALASYPMARLWQNTLAAQSHYAESEKQSILPTLDKYGFSFHERFRPGPVAVAGVVFLEEAGTAIEIAPLGPVQAMTRLGQNLYRKQWLPGMGKQRLQFEHLSALAQVLPAYRATRPKGVPTFAAFAEAIDHQIIRPLHGN